MEVMRRAPTTGYAFAAKDQYRRQIWTSFRFALDKWFTRVPVVIMPSSEALELETAESLGVPRRNIWAIDSNPAIVAQITRRYPGINTIGVTLDRAADRLISDGVMPVLANLDMTTNISPDACRTVSAFASCLAPISLVTITCLRGRESRALNLIDPEYREFVTIVPDAVQRAFAAWATDADHGRIAVLHTALNGFLLRANGRFATDLGSPPIARWTMLRRVMRYTSGTQSMMWSEWLVVQDAMLHVPQWRTLPLADAMYDMVEYIDKCERRDARRRIRACYTALNTTQGL